MPAGTDPDGDAKMPLPPGTEATLVKVGVELLQRSVPTGISWFTAWLKGKTILVVGQARSGKSTFISYFQHGLFQSELDTSKTTTTRNTPRFQVSLGKDKTLNLHVKTAVELPGQVGATAHAITAFKKKPDAILIFTDLSTPLKGEADRASAAWVKEFCDELEKLWIGKGAHLNQIGSIIVVLNKQDKVDHETMKKCKFEMEKTVKMLKAARGKRQEEVFVMPAIMVANEKGHELVDQIITRLAQQLGD